MSKSELKSRSDNPSIESDIDDLRAFAEPLQEEVVITPLMPVVARIMNLPEDLVGIEEGELTRIEQEVFECKRQLEEISYEYVRQIISKPEPSKVFRILSNANIFEKHTRKLIGKKIKTASGEKMEVTKELVDSLTRYRFSIGSPPVTPKGIETIEKILFSGTLHDIYSFRDLLGGDRGFFDRFMASLDKLVYQSTHYTTDTERKEYETKSRDFQNLEGLVGLPKTTITGTSKTAIRLIKEHLLGKHSNGTMPLQIVDEGSNLDENLIGKMAKKKESIFVIRVSKVPYDSITNSILQDRWKGLIGRLVIIDDSENANRSGAICVYSMNPCVTDFIKQFQVKDSGTPANTQMNLRLILENFRINELNELIKNVENKLSKLKREGVLEVGFEEARKKEWIHEALRDYLALNKFCKFLKFIKEIKEGSEDDLQRLNLFLQQRTAGQTSQYFFKNLPKGIYSCVSVPSGGGRRELALSGKFFLEKQKSKTENFKKQNLEKHREKLRILKEKIRVEQGTTVAESLALKRSLQQRKSPEESLREDGDNENFVTQSVINKVSEILYNTSERAENSMKDLINKLDNILGKNVPGFLKARATELFKKAGVESAAKMLERGGFRDMANKIRTVEGTLKRKITEVSESCVFPLKSFRKSLNVADLDIVDRMLNDIEHDSFEPHLALAEVSWSVEDVLVEDDYPNNNYIKIALTKDGRLDPESLKKKMESMEEALAHFPKLFELYCSSVILYVNDPHNPMSRVATPEIKLKLLDTASKYKLTILSDEPYHKQVAKEIKELNGDAPLVEFYEMNRNRFFNPVIIHTAISTTKWAMGAGRRTGVLVSNDKDIIRGGIGFEQFVKNSNTGSNTMSLYMDQETLSMGLMVKKICKELEPSLVKGDTMAAIDKLVKQYFSNLDDDNFNAPVYESLMKARNDLERLKIRGANPLEYRQYMSDFISELKNFRLDKQTQRDSEKRAKAAISAIERLSKEVPWLDSRCIKPEGPFYFCLQLDPSGNDPDIIPFLEVLSKARKIDVVPLAKGYVRFAFGGDLDGTRKSYELLSLAIETDLRLLIKYWEIFKNKKDEKNENKDLDPVHSALRELFQGGETELSKTIDEKSRLIEAINSNPSIKKKKLTNRFSPTASKYLSSIEPNSKSEKLLIRAVNCRNAKDFARSEEFQEIFNYYLKKVKNKIRVLESLNDDQLISKYGACCFSEKFASRDFKDVKKDLLEEIVVQIANQFFSDNAIKILALRFTEGVGGETKKDALLGAEARVREFMTEFIKAFTSEIGEKRINYKPVFQAAYERINNVKGDESLPLWAKKFISKAEFAGQTVATDPSPEMVTSGQTRVASFSRGIYRRDGDGNNAPAAEFFAQKFNEFAEVMNPKDYICKMVQIGPVRQVLVLHKSYSHYLVEELRLLPQFDADLDDLKKLKPDAISFLGIPAKVIGENYRIGYFLDKYNDEDSSTIPVSWVDAEDITDYMGYLKKPILTMANEKVKDIEGLPIHGSAFTMELKNGLRKTIVLAGDSGTGKSETIIAMVEQVINGAGGAKNVKSVELLSGDMLSLYEGDDEQVYMFGTESGDFMRMTDISEDWQERFRDLLHNASKTNLNHATNPRATINGLCDSEKFLKPIRINMFFMINNFEKREDSPFEEESNPENMLLDSYPRGYRKEKGTSGDQPNIFASVLHSDSLKKVYLIEKHGEQFDTLLGWDLIFKEDGKVKNAILSFNEIPNQSFRARQMVKDLFTEQKIVLNKKSFIISKVDYKVRENHFYVELKDEKGDNSERLLDRTVFDQIYNPLASTYCGNPFLDPRNMDKILKRFSKVMKKAGVITGTLYTQLAVPGEQFSGPARAAQTIIDFINGDPRINERFQKNKRKVERRLTEKYGSSIFGQEGIPQTLEAHNLWLLETQDSETIHLVNEAGETISVKTPYYQNKKREKMFELNPSLMTPEIGARIKEMCANADNAVINLDNFTQDIEKYNHIKTWDNEEELVYQILIANGMIRLGDPSSSIDLWPAHVKRAQKIAKELQGTRGEKKTA